LQHDYEKERQYLSASSYFSHYKNNGSKSTINKTKILNPKPAGSNSYQNTNHQKQQAATRQLGNSPGSRVGQQTSVGLGVVGGVASPGSSRPATAVCRLGGLVDSHAVPAANSPISSHQGATPLQIGRRKAVPL
jgi:hypothetical protein